MEEPRKKALFSAGGFCRRPCRPRRPCRFFRARRFRGEFLIPPAAMIGVCCGSAEFSKPFEICAGHGAFAVDVGAEEGGAEWFELRHHVFGRKVQLAAPAVDGDAAFCGVQRNDNSIWVYFAGETAGGKRVLDFSFAKNCAADDDLVGAPLCDFLSASDGSNPAANANFHSVVACELLAHSSRTRSLFVAGAHRGIQVDDVQPGIGFEFFQQAKDIGDSQFAFAAVDQLDGLAALQIDAGNQHGRRTSTLRVARNSLSSRMDCIVVVEDRGGERCVGCAFGKDLRKMFRQFCAARGDHGNGDCARNGRCERNVETDLRAVAIDGSEQEFLRRRSRRPFWPTRLRRALWIRGRRGPSRPSDRQCVWRRWREPRLASQIRGTVPKSVRGARRRRC